jgi:hypothetical protein
MEYLRVALLTRSVEVEITVSTPQPSLLSSSFRTSWSIVTLTATLTFRRRGLGTTYTVSLAFFEGLVLPEISRERLRRCLILCDPIGFQQSLMEASALRGAGRDYMAVSVPAQHAFHPKVWLMVSPEEVALLVGSGNLTQCGFMTNAELFDGVFLSANRSNLVLVADILRFLDGLQTFWESEDRAELLVVESLREIRNAVAQFGTSTAAASHEHTDVRFITSFGGHLVEQVRDYFEGGTLRVAAPYFGGSVSGLRTLKEKLSLRKLQVFPSIHSDDTLDVPLDELAALPDTTARRLALSSVKTFAHLKIYGSDGPKGSWMFTTSANCTEAALGGRNVEAGLMRRIGRQALREYFAGSEDELPDKCRQSDFGSALRWLPFVAVSRGPAIEIAVSRNSEPWLPLRGVTLTLQSGSQRFEYVCSDLFVHGSVKRVPWAWFAEAEDLGGSPLLRIQATAADGVLLAGAAFVDQPLLLQSDPMHRSAWRATLAILGGEGLPDASDLACVFHLVRELYYGPGEEDEEGIRQGRSGGSQTSEKGPKTPIWPPVSGALPDSTIPGADGHSVQWFQRILGELLGSSQANRAKPDSSVLEQDDDEAEPEEPKPAVLRAVRRAWGPAADSYEQLIRQMSDSRITAEAAHKIWPVATAILLVTLATRRQIASCVPGAPVPKAGELVDRFLRALFADRYQGWRHTFDDDETLGPTEPPVAAELHEHYAVRPTADIAEILRLLFVFQHARALTAGNLEGWLVFRELSGLSLTGDGPGNHVNTLYRKYLDGNSEGIDWPAVVMSWRKLARLGWADHPGYKALHALILHAEGTGKNRPPLPRQFESDWQHTEQRIRSKKQWRYSVSRLVRCCPVPNCRFENQIDPTKRALGQMQPVICRGCGSVLVPDRLADAFPEKS